MLDSLFIAFALVLIIEGLGPLLFPNKWRMYVLQLAKQPAKNLQQFGLVMVVLGSIWLIFIH